MIIGNRIIFGDNLSSLNQHWLESYGKFLIFLSKVDMQRDMDTLDLADLQCDESENYEEWKECLDTCHEFFGEKGFHVEGHTLKVLTEWFCEFCKSWHSKNKEIALREKKAKIEELRREIEELEKS